MAPQGLLKLGVGRLELLLAPGMGGAIARLDRVEDGVRTAILRGCDGALENVLEAASFPLVPFVNRVRGGAFTFRGREIALAPNMPGDPNPLHGQGWLGSWAVEMANEAQAALLYRHAPGEWPWAYEARQDFRLDEHGLSLGLSCRNLSDEPMPCGLGQHPYFPCTQETQLDTDVTDVWTIDEQVLPIEKLPAEGDYGLKQRAVCSQGLDHGFGGWGGSARIWTEGAPFELRLSSSQARFFQLYSPAGGELFVAEPVSHANAAINAPEAEWAGLGLRILDSGEEMHLDMRLDLIAVKPMV